jgi:transposase
VCRDRLQRGRKPDPPHRPQSQNALFAGHDYCGVAWGRIASLIETCKINGIEPFAYLKATLTAIANGHPQSRLDQLLPWNFKPSS